MRRRDRSGALPPRVLRAPPTMGRPMSSYPHEPLRTKEESQSKRRCQSGSASWTSLRLLKAFVHPLAVFISVDASTKHDVDVAVAESPSLDSHDPNASAVAAVTGNSIQSQRFDSRPASDVRRISAGK